jgi:hypothetical protein
VETAAIGGRIARKPVNSQTSAQHCVVFNLTKMRRALDRAGVIFVEADEGIGARLRKGLR